MKFYIATLLCLVTLGVAHAQNAVITPQNAHNLQMVSLLGEGLFYDIAWSHDGKTIAVGSSIGVWLYDPANMETEPQLLSVGEVWHLIFSPNDMLLAVADPSGKISVWDLEQGALAATFDQQDEYPNQIDFSPDNRWIISTGNHTVYLWDVQNREAIRQFEFPVCADCYVTGAVFSPDSRTIATSYEVFDLNSFFVLQLWNIETGTEIQRLEVQDYSSVNLAFDPKGSYVVAASGIDIITWNLATNTIQIVDEVAHYERDYGHGWGVSVVAFSPDGNRFASGGYVDGTIQVYDAIEQVEINAFKTEKGMLGLAFNPDASQLASIGWSNIFQIWDVETGEILYTSSMGRAGARQVVFTNQNTLITAMSDWPYRFDNTIRFWDVMNGQSIRVIEGGYTNADPGVWITNNDEGQLALAANGRIVLLNHETEQIILEGETALEPRLAYTPDGSLLAAAIGERLYVWDAASGNQTASASLPLSHDERERFRFEAIDPGQQKIAWIGKGKAGIVDLNLHTWTVFDIPLILGTSSVQLADQERLLIVQVSNQKESYFTVIDLQSGESVLSNNSTTGFTLSPGREKLIIYESEKTILWNTVERQMQQEWTYQEALGIVFSDHHTWLVTIEESGGAVIWEGNQKHLDLRTDGVSLCTVKFNADESILVGGDEKGNIWIWDTTNGELLTTLEGHTGNVCGFVFNHDGSLMASASVDGTIRIWGVGS